MRTLLEALDLTCDELSVHFVSKREIAKLHELYFQDPTPTDTISFPLDSPGDAKLPCRHLGEVFVCPAVALEYAKKKNLNPYLETTLYLVHGILHLLGYDDMRPRDKQKMRQKEKICLRNLQKARAVLKSPTKK